MTEPSPGEILRRLDEVSRQMASLAEQMQRDRTEAAAIYLRRDVYEAKHESLATRVTQVEAEVDAKDKAADTFRRQILAGVIITAIPAIFGLILALNNFIAGGGQTP